MSEKRRDSRGRILRNGEIQKPDGRYRYKYLDSFGEAHYVYSWRLDRNDRTPAGKKTEPSLREKEKQIAADIFDKIVPEGGRLTVIDLVEKYLSLKTGVRPSTEMGYRTVTNLLKKEDFGKKRIDKPNLPNLLYIGHLTYLWNPYKINVFGLFSFTFICIIDIIIFSDYTYVWGNRRGISGIFEKQKWYYIRV